MFTFRLERMRINDPEADFNRARIVLCMRLLHQEAVIAAEPTPKPGKGGEVRAKIANMGADRYWLDYESTLTEVADRPLA